MPLAVGIDPGTVSFDVCGLDDGEVFLAETISTSELESAPGRPARLLADHGRIDAAVGPSGYGLPLARLDELDARSLRLAFLSRSGEDEAISGLFEVLEELRAAAFPVWIVPGVIHLPTVPNHRKVNRVDMGTADKVCVAALGLVDQAVRWERPIDETDFLLVEIGGAFTSVLSLQGGRIVDGLGGSSGPPGMRGSGALDGEVAYLLEKVTKEHVFSGGALSVAVDTDASSPRSTDARTPPSREADDPRLTEGTVAWHYLMEGIEKACRSLLAVHPRPDEILLSGRGVRDAAVFRHLRRRLEAVAPVRPLEGGVSGVSAAAEGAALLANGLAGGEHRGLVRCLRLGDAAGSVLDHLHLPGTSEAAARWLEGPGG